MFNNIGVTLAKMATAGIEKIMDMGVSVKRKQHTQYGPTHRRSIYTVMKSSFRSKYNHRVVKLLRAQRGVGRPPHKLKPGTDGRQMEERRLSQMTVIPRCLRADFVPPAPEMTLAQKKRAALKAKAA